MPQPPIPHRNLLREIISGERTGLFSRLMQFGLTGLTPIYRAGVWLRNRKFDTSARAIQSVAVPVVSVGNLTTGGTGKTPMVIWLSRYFHDHQMKPAVLSRGYGRGREQKNDEALEFENRMPEIPYLQDPDRVAIARRAISEFGAEILILDDGFQHRRLGRNLDIVLIDATNPFGHGFLIPRGLLREPISSLRRADIVVVSRCGLVSPEKIDSIKQTILSAAPESRFATVSTVPTRWLQFNGQTHELNYLFDKKVLATSAIGNPTAFYRLMDRLNLNLLEKQTFDDHHRFTNLELKSIGSTARRLGLEAIVCTHKDLVKIGRDEIEGIPVFALQIDLQFDSGEQELLDLLKTLY